MIFYRIARAAFDSRKAAFSGSGAARADHRWTWGRPGVRAVYASDSLALACLETLVHIRPLPRVFPTSVFYSIEIDEADLERPEIGALPHGWRNPLAPAGARELGHRFLQESRAVALALPTTVLPLGTNALINPLHPKFDLAKVRGPFAFSYDPRLE